MSDFTGFNPGVARNEITNFYRMMNTIENDYYLGAYYLFMNLRDIWCSGKAIEFYNNNAQKTMDLDNEFINEINRITSKAIEAYNKMALANDSMAFNDPLVPTNLDANKDYDAESCFPILNSSDPNSGIVGMNVKEVENELNTYLSSMNKVVASLDDIPTEIALFDPDGTLQDAYRSLIDKMKGKIPERINTVKSDIQNAIKTEQDTTVLAKQQATEILEG